MNGCYLFFTKYMPKKKDLEMEMEFELDKTNHSRFFHRKQINK